METLGLILANVQQGCNLAVGIVVENEFQHTVFLMGEIGGQAVDKLGMIPFVGSHMRGLFQRRCLHFPIQFSFQMGKDTAAVEPHPLAFLAEGGIGAQLVAVVP